MKSTTNTIHGVRKGRAKPCDACRRRKVKCDGNAANGTTCSSCKSLKAACTYNGSRDTAGYIKNLELEVQRLKSTLGKVHAYHSGHGIGLDVGSPDTPNSHLRPNTPAEPPTVASSPVPGPSRTTPEEDIMAMLSDELMQLPPDIIPRASSAVPSSSFRVDVGVNPSELGTTSTQTPPPRSLSAPTTSTRRLSSIPAIHYTPTPSPTPSHHSSSSMYYTHIPGTSLLDDEPQPQWRIEDSLQMWSAPTRFAWEEWDSYTASISALTAGMPQPQTQPR